VEFEWDPDKARSNELKHGVKFEEATGVFADDLSSTVQDPDHSAGEARYLIFGQTPQGRHLVVGFTERGARIRLISARPMTRQERQAYES
jgi:hypothetical protein